MGRVRDRIATIETKKLKRKEREERRRNKLRNWRRGKGHRKKYTKTRKKYRSCEKWKEAERENFKCRKNKNYEV